MIPAVYNLPDAYRGDDYGPILLKVKDSLGGYLNFAGSEINLHVKNKKNCAIVLSWSTYDGTIELPDDYSIILKEKTSCYMGMPPGVYGYDLQVLKQKKITSYLRGTLSVTGDITDMVFCDCEFNGGSAVFVDECYCSMDYAFKAEILNPCSYNTYCASAVPIDGNCFSTVS
jgi:hypothetical protein